MKHQPAEETFTKIFITRGYGGRESLCGAGADSDQTEEIIGALSRLFYEMGVSTILDIPCGDFHWMRHVDLRDTDYLGADIVRPLVEANRRAHGRENIRFQHLNLICDVLPKRDLVLCRDCLVHFSFKDVFAALRNICRSESTYLLTTTFPSKERNREIHTGEWRPINLEAAPFNLPVPLRRIEEKCPEPGYGDKSLGLWHIEDVARVILPGGLDGSVEQPQVRCPVEIPPGPPVPSF